MSQFLQILHAIARLDGYGKTRQLRTLVDHQLRAGHFVRVVGMSADRNILNTWQEEGIDCLGLDRRWRYDPFVAWRLRQEMLRRPFDILHCWDQAAINFCSAVGTATPRVLAAPAIAPGITQTPPCEGVRAKFWADQCLPFDSRIVAIAGQLTREKRIEEAIWSFELVRTIHPQAHLLIFGDGPDRIRLERFARLATDSDGIRFVGFCSQWRELLTHVDVFWHVANSLPAGLEAMAAKVPVIASDNSTNRDLIEEGYSGYLVPWDKRALWARNTLQLFEERELATKVGAAGAQVASKRFADKIMLAAFDELYGQAL